MSMVFPFTGNAADISGFPVGYCNGEMSKSAAYKFDGKQTDISAAIFVPSTLSSTLKGNRMESVRVAICSTYNASDLRVWVRASLTGEDLASGTAESFKQGWNEIALSSPLAIDETLAESGFYIGYTYTQKAKSGAISTLPQPHEGALWIKGGSDADWQDLSAEGTLCIEGMVYGDNLPQHNMQLLSVTPDRWYIMNDGSLNAVVEVRNAGVATVTSFEVEAAVEGVSGVDKVTVECDLAYAATGSYKVTFHPDIVSADPSTLKATFTVTKVNGEADEDITDNSLQASFNVIENAYHRNVLLEEFTTEECPNCPRVAGYIHNILENPVYADRVNTICYHAGYGEDFLTNTVSRVMTWFYGSDGTYAPATMVDRNPKASTATSPLFCPSSQEELQEVLDYNLGEPAQANVVISASDAAEGDAIDFIVTGHRYADSLLEENGRVVVALVENDIESEDQAGSGTGYLHQHAVRAVSSIWGEEIDWNGNDYSYSCTIKTDSSWKRENMQAVAYIYRYDSENPAKCQVENSASISLDPSGVSEISKEPSAKSVRCIFNASGIKTGALSKGINIVVYDDKTTSKIIR